MSSLDLYPIEPEEWELLEPSDDFWKRIEDQPYEWDLLEEANSAAGIVVANKPKQKTGMKVNPLTTPTAPSTLSTVINNTDNHVWTFLLNICLRKRAVLSKQKPTKWLRIRRILLLLPDK